MIGINDAKFISAKKKSTLCGKLFLAIILKKKKPKKLISNKAIKNQNRKFVKTKWFQKKLRESDLIAKPQPKKNTSAKRFHLMRTPYFNFLKKSVLLILSIDKGLTL